MNDPIPTNLPEVLAYLTAKFTQPFSAGTNLPVGVRQELPAYADTSPEIITGIAGGEAQESTEVIRSKGGLPRSLITTDPHSCGGQFISASVHNQTQPEAKAGDAGTLSRTQILHLLELGIGEPEQQEDRR